MKVTNLDQNISLTVRGDKILHLVNTWIHVHPNPMQESTTIEFYNPRRDYVIIGVYDIMGRKLLGDVRVLPEGNCVYELSGLGIGTFIVSVVNSSWRESIKVISTQAISSTPHLELKGIEDQVSYPSPVSLFDVGEVQMFYNDGEMLRFTAYYKSKVAIQEDIPTSSKTIFFDFSFGTDPYMMPYYTGKILPTPKQVEYSDEYLSLSNTAIILNDIDQDDPRLKYLLDRITRYGGKYEIVSEANSDYTCIIKVNDDSLTPPQAPQGYIIESNGRTISLKGFDYQGLLWAISSLNQMIFYHDGKTLVRKLNVIDWPDLQLRGMLPETTYDITQLAHLMVAFKLNIVDFRATLSRDKEHAINWRLPRSDVFRQRLSEVKEKLTSLGILWYAGGRFLGYDQVPQINCSSDSDFYTIYRNFALPIANAGGNLSVQFDDIRYPLHPDDISRFGSASRADYYFLTRLYDSLSSHYPDIKIAFCPPYYWGPVGANPLPESRDAYLDTIGRLPLAFDIYWTGPRVRSDSVSPEDVQWEVSRIKRKPYVFQNKIGTPHAYDYHYMTDPLYSLSSWYYPGYLSDIKAYLLNGGDIDKSGALVSLADWAWNYQSFEPEESIKDAIMKLASVEAYPILKAMNAQLSVFDPYKFEVSFAALRNIKKLKAALDSLEVLYEQLLKIHGGSAEFWTAVNSSHITRVRHYMEKLNKAYQDPIVQEIINRPDASITMYYAVKDGNFDPNSSDILLEPDDFSGCGVINYGYTNEAEGIYLEDRLTAYITGQGTPNSQMTTTFRLNQYSPTAEYQLIITGADDFLDEKCPIRITLNNVVLFDGPNNFSNKTWNTQKFNVPANVIDSVNVLTITNTSPNGNYDAPPAFFVNYVVVHKLR